MMRAASRRGQRLIRRQSRRLGVVPLNLVAMIDMFTSLLFFLLVTSPNVDTLQSPKTLVLPTSSAYEQPKDSPILTITRDRLTLQGREIMSIQDIQNSQSNVLAPLKSELFKVSQVRVKNASGATTRGDINIMADKDLPYGVLKKVMATCADMKFARIGLSVNHSSKGPGQ
jgi:biopolymer transport protein ExbD